MSRMFALVAVLGFNLSLVAQTTPKIAGSLGEGAYTVAGTGQATGAVYSPVKIYLCSAAAPPAAATDCSANPAILTNGAANAVTADPNGNFAAVLQTVLKSGSGVWVTQVATPAGGGAAITSLSSVQTVGASAKLPTIQQPVKDQQNPIVGTATASATGAAVQVQLYVKAPGADSIYSPQGAPENVSTDGTYTLHETVTLGEVISVKQLGGAGDGVSSGPVTVQALDNEREHIDFFAGTIISESELNFAQADTFLALNVDRALILPGFYPVTTSTINKSRHPGVNTFFQARLTTIPINASTTTTTTTAPTTAAGAAAPSFSSVLTTQKTGHFEAGLYIPFTFARVPLQAPKSPTQTFYIAPLGRFGFNTLAGSSQSITTTSPTTVTTTVATALGTTNPLPSTYNFFVGGLRLRSNQAPSTTYTTSM